MSRSVLVERVNCISFLFLKLVYKYIFLCFLLSIIKFSLSVWSSFYKDIKNPKNNQIKNLKFLSESHCFGLKFLIFFFFFSPLWVPLCIRFFSLWESWPVHFMRVWHEFFSLEFVSLSLSLSLSSLFSLQSGDCLKWKSKYLNK